MAQPCTVISHKLTVEYTCGSEKVTVELDRPTIHDGQYYDDWHYTYTIVDNCPKCGRSHSLEI